MEASFWHERWERGQLGFHQDEHNPYLVRHFSRLGLAPGDTVFVPLCGKSLDMLWLVGEGYRVLGVELSSRAVQDFFAENGLESEPEQDGAFTRWRCGALELLCGDFFALGPAHLAGVRGVYDRAALIALPAAMRRRYVAQLARVLPAALPTLLVTLDYPPAEREGPPFSVDEAEVRALYAPAYAVEPLARIDLLETQPRYRARGLSRIEDCVYRLRPA